MNDINPFQQHNTYIKSVAFSLDSILHKLDLLISIENINSYPFNLNNKLNDNIIETKNEIELEYINNFSIPVFVNTQEKKIKGSYENSIYIY